MVGLPRESRISRALMSTMVVELMVRKGKVIGDWRNRG
jgi:hypothetical protein